MRDCKTCIHSEIGHGDSNGCTSWNCEYINKKEALRAYKERMAIVRCKDCIHRDPEDRKCAGGGLERDGCYFPVSDDYFCAYGERIVMEKG